MRLNPSEVQIEDHVVRMHRALWIETCNNRVIDVSRYPKVGIVEDEDEEQPSLFAIVAYPRIDNDDVFEPITYFDTPDAAEEYFKNLIQMLQNPPTVH